MTSGLFIWFGSLDQVLQPWSRIALAEFLDFGRNLGVHAGVCMILDDRIDPRANLLHLRLLEPARSDCRGTDADAARIKGFARIKGHGVAV